ncbi:MAG TPA: cytochrome b [Sphingomicrobium sp.]|nr:cytochrome b [Sphingomicrobium sp.]
MNDGSTFNTATRIAAGDDKTNYDNVAISLHWATAILVLFQFASAETWDWLGKSTRETMQSLHISFGVLLTAVIIARIVWRLIPGHQRPSIVSGWVEVASKAVHYLLYALLVAQACLGFAFRWAQGHPVSFFGLFGFPTPFGVVDKATRHTIHDLHEKVGWAIIIIALGHALAALYHHYRLHDRVLGRMLPLARRSEERSAAR